VRTAKPRFTTHGAPPLGTPAIVIFGLEPTIGEKKLNSSATTLTEKVLAKRQDNTTVRIALLFMVPLPLIFKIWVRSLNPDRATNPDDTKIE
jgi:hypothetical protein